MAKIYRVIQIKLNQLVSENVHMISDLEQNVFKRYHSIKYLSEMIKIAAKINCIDMEQNYVTVTLYVL